MPENTENKKSERFIIYHIDEKGELVMWDGFGWTPEIARARVYLTYEDAERIAKHRYKKVGIDVHTWDRYA